MKFVRKLNTINQNADGKKFRTVSIPGDYASLFPSDLVTIQALPNGAGVWVCPVVGEQLKTLAGKRYVD